MSESKQYRNQEKTSAKNTRNRGQPKCPIHKCNCEAYSTKPYVTHYRCPKEGCVYSEKKPRSSVLKSLGKRVKKQETEVSGDQDGFSAR